MRYDVMVDKDHARNTFLFLTEQELIYFAQDFSNKLLSPIIIGFSGNIGVGKTTFIRALLKSLGIMDVIKSPTFSLVESYNNIHHLDLYRLNCDMDLESIGFRDLLDADAMCLIEWPEKVSKILSIIDLHIIISIGDQESKRIMQLRACTAIGNNVLLKLRR